MHVCHELPRCPAARVGAMVSSQSARPNSTSLCNAGKQAPLVIYPEQGGICAP